MDIDYVQTLGYVLVQFGRTVTKKIKMVRGVMVK